MPKIPWLDPGGIDRATREPARLGRGADSADFGSSRGALALGTAAKGAGEAQVALYEAEMESRTSASLMRATQALNTLEGQVEAETDFHKRPVLWQEGSQKILADIRSGINSERFQEDFDLKVQPYSERSRVRVDSGVRQAQLDTMLAEDSLALEAALDGRANSANAAERLAYGREIDAAIARVEKIRPQAAAALRIAADNRIERDDLEAEAYDRADEIMRVAADNYAKQDEMIAKLPEHLRRQTTLFVEQQQQRRDRGKTQIQEQQRSALYKIVATSPGQEGWISEPDLWIRMEREGWDQASQQWAINIHRGMMDPANAFPNKEYWIGRVQLDFERDHAATANRDLVLEFGDKIPPGELAKLMAKQREAPPQAWWAEDLDKRRVLKFGKETEDKYWSREAEAWTGKTRRLIEAEIDLAKRNGRAVDQEAIRKLLWHASYTPNIWGTDDPLRGAEEQPEPLYGVEPEKHEKAQIEQYILSKGGDPTEEAVMRIWDRLRITNSPLPQVPVPRAPDSQGEPSNPVETLRRTRTGVPR